MHKCACSHAKDSERLIEQAPAHLHTHAHIYEHLHPHVHAYTFTVPLFCPPAPPPLQLAQGIQLTDLDLSSHVAAAAPPAPQTEPGSSQPPAPPGALPPPPSSGSLLLDAQAAAASRMGEAEGAAAPGLPPAHAIALDQALGYHKKVCHVMPVLLGPKQLQDPQGLKLMLFTALLY